MRNLVAVLGSLVLFLPLAAAKDKISSQWKCDAKPEEQHSIAVEDHEGHAYSISKGKCSSERGSMGDSKEQEGSYTQFQDVSGSAVKNHGIFVVTVAGGDKVF